MTSTPDISAASQPVRARKVVVGRVSDVPEGTRLLVEVNGRSIGVFNVGGAFYALLNRCPHLGGELCKGDILNLVHSERPGDVRLDRSRHLITCPLHGWEYDLETGQSWFNPERTKTRLFPVSIERGGEVEHELTTGAVATAPAGATRVVDASTHRVKGPYTAEVVPVSVEEEYIVISLSAPTKPGSA